MDFLETIYFRAPFYCYRDDSMKNRKLSRIIISVAALILVLIGILHFLHNGYTDLLGWTWLILGLIFATVAIIDPGKPK
jgi:hypothetical membrane protein